jgi:hypothetical protein
VKSRPLSPADMEVLEFARAMRTNGRLRSGRRDAEILERFGHSPERYAQRLQHILTLPAAEVYDPETVRRERRLRDERAAHRGWGQVNAS